MSDLSSLSSLSDKIPFTQLVDIVNNGNFPLDYRIKAAALAKQAIQKQLAFDGGRVDGNAKCMFSMVAREKAQTPGFATIYDQAPEPPELPKPVLSW